ncbi:hypothetical protein ES702_03498 [subsurface metagenome]
MNIKTRIIQVCMGILLSLPDKLNPKPFDPQLHENYFSTNRILSFLSENKILLEGKTIPSDGEGILKGRK